jgi:hypothetical protein
MAAGYFFGTFRVYDFGVFLLEWDVCAGAGWVENIHHPILNPENIGVSNHWNAYIDFNLNSQFNITERFSGFASFGISHFSNGAVKKPNKGLNMLGCRVGLVYRLEKEQAILINREQNIEINRKWGMDLRYGRGITELDNYGERFHIENLQLLFAKRISNSYRIGFGVDIVKDNSLVSKQYLLNGDHSGKLGSLARKLEGEEIFLYQGGIVVSNEFIMRRLSLMTQLGFIAFYSYDTFPVYQKYGVRYRLLEGLFADLSLHVSGYKAKNITWGIGYSLNRGLN